MTISYAGNFARLLLRWKGSIWKSIWVELMVFLAIYYSIYFLYATVFWQTFEKLCLLFNDYTKQIPLTFLLGFYVALIVKRWWEQFQCVAWPDELLSYTCALWTGDDEKSRLARHTVARYANLTAALAWREISVKVRCRFPFTQTLVTVGLMTQEEHDVYENTHIGSIQWQLPISWIQRMAEELVEEGRVTPPLYCHFLRELLDYRAKFRDLFCYDWVCVPLVYTQVAALATYGYFGFCLLGRQFLEPEKSGSSGLNGTDEPYTNPFPDYISVNFYVPIFTILQFLFFVGWFKVGQDLMRPFGTDDDDIELNYILDRNVAASFALVHSARLERPPATFCTVKDKLYQQVQKGQTVTLPHTRISAKIREHPPKMFAFVDTTNAADVEVELPPDDVDVNSVDVELSAQVMATSNDVGSTTRHSLLTRLASDHAKQKQKSDEMKRLRQF